MLKKLTNEVVGLLNVYEPGLRELIGHTNFNTLKMRTEAGRYALAIKTKKNRGGPMSTIHPMAREWVSGRTMTKLKEIHGALSDVLDTSGLESMDDSAMRALYPAQWAMVHLAEVIHELKD